MRGDGPESTGFPELAFQFTPPSRETAWDMPYTMNFPLLSVAPELIKQCRVLPSGSTTSSGSATIEAEPGLQNSAPAGSLSAPEKKRRSRFLLRWGVILYRTYSIF